MKLCLISDQHGNLPSIPECNILLIGGDICPATNHSTAFQYDWLDHEFRQWLKSVPAKHIVGIAGNHDFIFQSCAERISNLNLPWNYLQDSSITIDGIKTYGTPWQPFFFNWAFNTPNESIEKQEEWLRDKFACVPNDTDIIIAHGPPYGGSTDWEDDYRPRMSNVDITPDGIHVGSKAMLDTIKRVQPKIVVTGHLHSGYGKYILPLYPDVCVYNAAILDEEYNMTKKPIMVDWN